MTLQRKSHDAQVRLLLSDAIWQARQSQLLRKDHHLVVPNLCNLRTAPEKQLTFVALYVEWLVERSGEDWTMLRWACWKLWREHRDR